MKTMSKKLHKSESGIIAIFSVLIIMGILTLLVLGFSAITRQAQRRTLDDILSAQAYYAAETGVNRLMGLGGLVQGSNSTCEDVSPALQAGVTFDRVLDAANNIDIPCMLVEGRATDIRRNVTVDEPAVIQLKYDTSEPVENLIIEWDSQDLNNRGGLPTSGTPVLTNAAGWVSGGQPLVGMLRIDLVPFAAVQPANRSGLINATQTVYLYPTSAAVGNAPIVPPSGVNAQATISMVECNNAVFSNYRCRANIDVFENGYYIRVLPYYSNVSLQLTALNASGTALRLVDGQRSFDATGRANDVLRRVQVRAKTEEAVTIESGYHEVFSLLTASSICKRIVGMPGASSVDTTGLPGYPVGGDPACALP